MEKAVRALSFPLFVRLLSVPSLLCLLSLLCCVPAGRPCLQCDRRVRLLHEDYLLAAASATIEDQIELKKILDYAYVTYTTTSNQYSGVIDPTTLYRASTEYQSEFDRFQGSQLTGPLTFEAIQILEKGRKILEKHLQTFVQKGLCPNKCGLLYQRVMNCLSCQYMLHTCPSTTQDCGEYPVEAAEGGQAVLDCFLPWHSLVVGRTDYHYTWAPGTQRTANLTEGDFRVLVVTEDSSVVLNQLHVDEEGTYRCLLTDGKGTVLSRTHFLLTVTPSPVPTPRSLLTLPSLPPSYDASPISHPPTDLLLVIIIMVTALSLTASLALAIAFGLMTLRQQREEEEREGKR
ncbi:izumo sperm-egg fusion protein 1 isoform X1 [Oncorhynchus tshawytscha]|uniref:Ig-like domain-containing protein n=1 Tax=Oncorhynchus tshawytscha TaxID=74940 RepID=A0A8C8CJV6_ONCTS|nr:izumo sperm-egg fusion protein 1 isoform X1 [Oncorhynchus tshawytscha]